MSNGRMIGTANDVVEAISGGQRNVEGRWLSAKQRDWLYGVWLRQGGAAVSASFPGISGTLSDGTPWGASLFGCGRGGCKLTIGISAQQAKAEIRALHAAAESAGCVDFF